LLGVIYAALGAFTFALNNVTMRRGVVTGSVQGMALTVPVGGLSFLVITIVFGELGQLVIFPTWRNGHRDRTLDTRVGALQLRISKLRQGSYFPPFLEARKSSALVAGIQEAWIGGVSTRRVDDLVQAMGLSRISKSQVSKLCKDIERLNKEVKRRADVVGIFPNEAAIIRLIGAVLLEQNDEWQLQQRDMQVEAMAELAAAADPRQIPCAA
jgi:transposase-like protein